MVLWRLENSQGPELKGSHMRGEPTFGRAGERGLQGIAELVVDERQRSARLPGIHVQLDGPVQLRSALALRCDAPHQGPPLLRTLDEALHGTCTERRVTIETLLLASLLPPYRRWIIADCHAHTASPDSTLIRIRTTLWGPRKAEGSLEQTSPLARSVAAYEVAEGIGLCQQLPQQLRLHLKGVALQLRSL